MLATKAIELLKQYAKCPQCGNDLIGAGEGSITIDDNFFTRQCKCGYCRTIDSSVQPPAPPASSSPIEKVSAWLESKAKQSLLQGFYSSLLVKELGIAPPESATYLEQFVRDGKLLRRYEFRCPDCGTVLMNQGSLDDGDKEPFPDTAHCCRCDKFQDVVLDDLETVYMINREYWKTSEAG